MKHLFYIILLIFSTSVISQDIGGDYYVDPDGDDEAAGTYAAPWATWQKAFEEAVPGDTVYFMGGIYYSLSPNYIRPNAYVPVGNSGVEGNPICYFGYPGDTVILDCKYHCDSSDVNYNQAISMEDVEYINFKDFTVRNVFACDSNAATGAISAQVCANMIFENVNITQVGHRGFHYWSGAWNQWDMDEDDPEPEFTSDSTYWINCDVYELCDTFTTNPGNMADAWKTNSYATTYLSWEGCRAWNYSDDGFDPSGSGTRVFNNCWAMSSDKYEGVDPIGGIEGGGFKTTGTWELWDEQPTERKVIVKNCLAMFCLGGGFINNAEAFYQSNANYYNNTSWKNEIGFYDIGGNDFDTLTTIFRNNLTFESTGITSTDDSYEVACGAAFYVESNNSWDKILDWPKFRPTDTVTVTTADFISTDSSTLVSLFTAPRQAGGALPAVWPLMLVPGSDLIDMGTQPYASDSVDFSLDNDGLFPDIGYYEHEGELTLSDSVNLFMTGDATTITENNGTLQAIDTVWPLNASFLDVTYSEHPGTGSGTVTQSGEIQAVSDGTDSIRITAQDGTGNTDFIVLTYSNQDDNTIPTVITSVTSGAHSVQAACGGNVTATGGAAVTARGVCWNTSENPTTANSHTVDGTGTGAFTSSMTNLNNSTLYYVRAYATNSEGTAYGDNRQVTTSAYSVLRGANKSYRLNGKTVVL